MSLGRRVPIAKLSPNLDNPDECTVSGVITLIWPYSSSTKTLSLLLVEPDFRLRAHCGQVRIQISGPAAKAFAQADIISSDFLNLSLKGADWVQDEAVSSTPGKGIRWCLSYRRVLNLQVERGEGNDLSIDIDRHDEEEHSPEISSSPSERLSHRSDTPNRPSREPLIGSDQVWSTPAFLRHLEHLDQPYDPFFNAEQSVANDRSKKFRFGKSISQWRFAERTPSPVKSSLDDEVEDEFAGRALDPKSVPEQAQVPTVDGLPEELNHRTFTVADETPQTEHSDDKLEGTLRTKNADLQDSEPSLEELEQADDSTSAFVVKLVQNEELSISQDLHKSSPQVSVISIGSSTSSGSSEAEEDEAQLPHDEDDVEQRSEIIESNSNVLDASFPEEPSQQEEPNLASQELETGDEPPESLKRAYAAQVPEGGDQVRLFDDSDNPQSPDPEARLDIYDPYFPSMVDIPNVHGTSVVVDEVNPKLDVKWAQSRALSVSSKDENSDTEEESEADLIEKVADGSEQTLSADETTSEHMSEEDAVAQSRHLEQLHRGRNFGLRTQHAYFYRISSLSELFGNVIDVIGLVIDSTKPERARKGPNDYNTSFYLTDLSVASSDDDDVNSPVATAQIFRHRKTALPVAGRGDAILFRNVRVHSNNNKLGLLSTNTSAWAVFPQDAHEPSVEGPPIEYGPEEEQFASTLRTWWANLDEVEKRRLKKAVPGAS